MEHITWNIEKYYKRCPCTVHGVWSMVYGAWGRKNRKERKREREPFREKRVCLSRPAQKIIGHLFNTLPLQKLPPPPSTTTTTTTLNSNNKSEEIFHCYLSQYTVTHCALQSSLFFSFPLSLLHRNILNSTHINSTPKIQNPFQFISSLRTLRTLRTSNHTQDYHKTKMKTRLQLW